MMVKLVVNVALASMTYVFHGQIIYKVHTMEGKKFNNFLTRKWKLIMNVI